jgi:hypothetical protein
MKKTFLKTLVATAIVGATVALSSALAFAATYTFDADDYSTTGDITSTIKVGTDNFFTVNATSSKKWGVDDSGAKSVGLTGAHTRRFKTGGTIDSAGRNIEFTVDKNATVVVECLSGSSSDARPLILCKDSAGKTNASKTASVPGKVLGGKSTYFVAWTIEETGTYYIGSGDSGMNIYSITVETEDTAKSSLTVSNGAVYTIGSDSYIIAAVSEDEAKDATALTISLGNDGKEIASSDTVYESVVIDGKTINASDVNGDYLYAVKVSGADTSDKATAIETFVKTLATE